MNMTANERELLQLCKNTATAAFTLKAVLCAVALGDAFFKETKSRLAHRDINGLIEIVNREGQT